MHWPFIYTPHRSMHQSRPKDPPEIHSRPGPEYDRYQTQVTSINTGYIYIYSIQKSERLNVQQYTWITSYHNVINYTVHKLRWTLEPYQKQQCFKSMASTMWVTLAVSLVVYHHSPLVTVSAAMIILLEYGPISRLSYFLSGGHYR